MPVPPSAEPDRAVLAGGRNVGKGQAVRPETRQRVADIAVDQRRAGDRRASAAAMRSDTAIGSMSRHAGSTSAAISRIISKTALPVSAIDQVARTVGRAGRAEIAGERVEGHQRMRRPQRQQHPALAAPGRAPRPRSRRGAASRSGRQACTCVAASIGKAHCRPCQV